MAGILSQELRVCCPANSFLLGFEAAVCHPLYGSAEQHGLRAFRPLAVPGTCGLAYARQLVVGVGQRLCVSLVRGLAACCRRRHRWGCLWPQAMPSRTRKRLADSHLWSVRIQLRSWTPQCWQQHRVVEQQPRLQKLTPTNRGQWHLGVSPVYPAMPFQHRYQASLLYGDAFHAADSSF